jgi:hypothetical protein
MVSKKIKTSNTTTEIRIINAENIIYSESRMFKDLNSVI